MIRPPGGENGCAQIRTYSNSAQNKGTLIDISYSHSAADVYAFHVFVFIHSCVCVCVTSMV